MKKLLIKKQKLRDDHPHQIADRLFIGNYAGALNKFALAELNITMVITCLNIEERDRVPEIEYIELTVKDKPEEKISLFFEKVYNAVSQHLNANSTHRCLINW
jgi:hypothetical protein